jgi:hypothetical protein
MTLLPVVLLPGTLLLPVLNVEQQHRPTGGR